MVPFSHFGAEVEEIRFNIEDWTGADMFLVDYIPVVTEKVIQLLRENDVDNWSTRPVFTVEGETP